MVASETPRLKQLNKTEKAAIVQQALQNQGFRDGEIAALMNVTRPRVCAINKKIKAGTLNPLVSKAKKAVKSLLQGKAIGDMKEVRGSDVLTAAKMVLDRADPIVTRNENISKISHTYELKDEDRNRYKKALGIIDAEYQVVTEQKFLPHETISYESTDADSQGVQDSNEPSSHSQSPEGEEV